MGGGVPSNTTSTTTVNQSPWQNPTYQALMLGTKNKPGPITNILRSNQGYMDAYNGLLAQGITPADIMNSNTYNPTVGGAGTSFQDAAPTQAAAEGGIMNAAPKGYARGATVNNAATPNYNDKTSAPDKLSSLQSAISAGYKPKPAEVTFMNNMADTAAMQRQLGTSSNVPYSIDPKTGTIKAAGRDNNQSTADYTNYLNTLTRAGATIDPKTMKQYGVQTREQQRAAADAAKTAASREQILQQSMGQTAFMQRVQNPDGTYSLQSTNPLFNQAVSRVQAAQELPQQFAQATDAYNRAIAGLQGKTDYRPDVVKSGDVTAAQIKRGDIRDAYAQQANVERMGGAQNVQGAMMSGPQSWTQRGVAAQYMNPYVQNVVNQETFEANRQAAQRQNQLNSQATQQKAYGGTRAAIQQSEANRNLGYLLADIEDKGLSQAYQQGMGQFMGEQGLGQQAKQTNVGSLNQANLANQLYGYGGFQSQAANQGAQNQAYNNYVQQYLTAQGMNQGMDYNTANQNAQLLQAASISNQNAALQASIANQQAGLQANQQNLGAYGLLFTGAQGLGGLGASQASTNLANIGALGQAASAWQNLGQQYLNTGTQNAQNAINFPSNLYSPAVNMINSQPTTGGSTTQFGTNTPASPLAKGGTVEAHKEWDKAKGGKSSKTGIASKGWN